MERMTLVKLHAAAGALAMALIALFWGTVLASGLSGRMDVLASVRLGILFALPVLVLALAGTGVSGAVLAGGSRAPEIRAKQRRMALAAANGLLVLIPGAVFLGWRAARGEFYGSYFIVQAVEMVAGPVNLLLLGLNLRAGLKMSAGRRRVAA